MRFFDESAIEWWLPAAYLILYLVFFAIAQCFRWCKRSSKKSSEQDGSLHAPLLQDGEGSVHRAIEVGEREKKNKEHGVG